jgi:hypothetical protein
MSDVIPVQYGAPSANSQPAEDPRLVDANIERDEKRIIKFSFRMKMPDPV